MRYIRFIARSPRLLGQLALILVLAGLVGGTGLVGLLTARSAVTDITNTQVPTLVHLLSAERDIAQANYAGVVSLVDPDLHRRVEVDIPRIRGFTAAAWTEFLQYQALGQRNQGPEERKVVAQARALLLEWRTLAAAAPLMGTGAALGNPTLNLRVFTGIAASVVVPLTNDVNRLIQFNLADAARTRNASISSSRNATFMLCGVIAVAVLLAGAFQVIMAAREHRRKALVQQSADLVVLLDTRGIIQSASPSYERLLGYRTSELIGCSVLEFVHPEDHSAVKQALAHRVKDADGVQEREFRVLHADGSYLWLTVMAVNRLRDPLLRGIVVTGRDITARKQTEADLAFQASHDALTRLPNRLLLREKIEHTLGASPDGKKTASLLLLDLDRFKEVNDTLGHAAGDLLLQEVSRRLRAALRADDVVARLGGDEFAILLPDALEPTALQLATRLREELEVPFLIAEQSLAIGASIGIALYPEHGQDPDLLLQHADVAMYEAKRKRHHAVVYNPTQDHYTMQRLALMRDLRQTIQGNELMLYYQPKIDLATNRLQGVEALLRWLHPERGFIPPDYFIPMAEQTGLIDPLTTWVLETALRQCRAWQSAGRTIPVAVNLSARALQDQRLPFQISQLLLRQGLSPACLTLEITESSLMIDPAGAEDVLTRLHALGVRLSIDDFGTGYSSLAYLKDLPVQEVKIDKSFVMGMRTAADTKYAAIVRSVIGLAHALDLRVVAEGVEDAETRIILDDLDCDTIQGYHISRAIPASELDQWLKTVGVVSYSAHNQPPIPRVPSLS
ncbi:MAG TPA: EAL domain-containing protein [Chloroflexota bacterium]